MSSKSHCRDDLKCNLFIWFQLSQISNPQGEVYHAGFINPYILKQALFDVPPLSAEAFYKHISNFQHFSK